MTFGLELNKRLVIEILSRSKIIHFSQRLSKATLEYYCSCPLVDFPFPIALGPSCNAYYQLVLVNIIVIIIIAVIIIIIIISKWT